MGKTRYLFKKIRDSKVTFHAKMVSVKDRNYMDLTEAEDIQKRWQEYKEQCKNNLNDPDNHKDMIMHLEPDSLESQACSTPGFPVHHQLAELAQNHVLRVGDDIQPSHPLASPSPVFNLSSIRVFSIEMALLIRWTKCWSFSFSISPSNEYSVLISFRIDWLDLHAVQGTLKSLLQQHSAKTSILQCSAFFTVQHLHPYMTTGKATTGKTTDLCWQVLQKLNNSGR